LGVTARQHEGRRRVIEKQFWAGRRVLLTGHTGFKGAWLALWLRRLGADVHGFALAPETTPALHNLLRLSDAAQLTQGDLRDAEAVRSAVRRAQPQIVLHLAAQSLVRRSVAEPVATLATNVMGTVHLLEALREVDGLSAVLVVTSDKVYANDERERPFSEQDPLGGKDPYSASKAAAELVTRAYAATFFAGTSVRVGTARGGNVIGGGDYSQDRIVPDIIRAAERGEKPALRMPSATRPWQHVLDCLGGYLLHAEALAERDDVPRALNFGPEPSDPISVGRLAEMLLEALGHEPAFLHEPPQKSIEMRTLAVDATLAREALGWRDRLPGKIAIEWTAQWYRAVGEGRDPREVTLSQIERFSETP
jgi:CDP-glucose 4,6-dehydratase